MEEAPENGKESPHSAHANGMNEYICVYVCVYARASQDLQFIRVYQWEGCT